MLQKSRQVLAVAKRLDLGFELPQRFVLPVEQIATYDVPGHAIDKADGFRGREQLWGHHHFRRLAVIAADLINAQRNGLFLGGVFALDHQHRDAIDQEDHIGPVAIAPVVQVVLLRHLEAVAGPVVKIDQLQIPLAHLGGFEEGHLPAQRAQKVSIAPDVGE